MIQNSRNRILLVIVFAVILLASLTLAVGAGFAEDNIGDGAAASSVTTVLVGNVRVQLLSDSLVRIEDKMQDGKFEDRASYIVQNRTNWNEVEYTIEQANGESIIKTSSYFVHVPDKATAEDAYITYTNGEKLWDFSSGETGSNVYLPSPSDELQSWYFTDDRVIPSSYGYSDDYKGIEELQGWDFSSKATDIFVFLPKGDYERFCSDYIKLTGSTNMTTLQMLGYWDSRWYPYSDETALQQIQDYLDRGYSIDMLVIDTDWRDASEGVGYEINKELFPNMSAFLDKCEEMGVDIVFNDHPEPKNGTSNGLDKDEVSYRNKNLTLLLSLGLDYWWYDRNWYVSLNSATPDISVYAFGMYAYQWITDEYYESITDINEYAKRSLIMGNIDGCLHGKWNYASDLSAHRYSIQWTGDIGSSSEALAQEIYAAIMAGAEVGLPYVSSDIGGHNQHVTNEQYVRWMQYGALSTICRVHQTTSRYIGDEGRMPWLFGETAEEVSKTYLGIRYRLLPLYYELARENYDKGLAIMRRLDIKYPEYVESSANDEYLLGDYILIAPIDTAGDNDKVDENRLFHYENGKKVTGLKAEYYNNMNWSGTPERTQVDKNIYFNWGTDAPTGLNSDQFSIKWSGYVSIGSNPAKLNFIADDYVKVYIDGEQVIDGKTYSTNYTTDVLDANSTHQIEVYFYEDGYDAYIYMTYQEQYIGLPVNSREVFIPEGTWIDVWTGERFVGPQTYTVSHELTTSPIFVREGALITLARDTQNTNSSDWSEITLDVYPSINFSANTVLYEDDTKTQGYKDGQYRTTDISMKYDENKKSVIVNIDKAQGSFEGKLAFTERTWNVRIHNNPGWGSLKSIKLNGKDVTATFIAQDAEASPFAFSGGALDGDIYTFTFNGSVNEAYEIEFVFDNMTLSAVNEGYDKTAVDFDVEVKEVGTTIDLTQDGIFDWISYDDCNDNFYTEMSNANIFGLASSYDDNWTTNQIVFAKDFGNRNKTYGGIASQKDFNFQINVTKKGYYTLFVGGYLGTAKLTVRDRAGNVKTVFVGNIDGEFKNAVVIKVTEDTVGTLYVNYSALGTTPDDQETSTFLTLFAVVASENPFELSYIADSSISAVVESNVNVSKNVNLSNAGSALKEQTLDWMHFGYDKDNGIDEKNNSDVIADVSFQRSQAFYDYQVSLSYTDGTKQQSMIGSKRGLCSWGDIRVSLNVTKDTKHVILYTGTWLGTNLIEVYNSKGELISQSVSFSAGSTSVNREVCIAIDATEDENITIVIRDTDTTSGGNVSLAGIAVTGNKNA